MKVYKWQKKIGDCHIAGTNQTLCGIPMLGNNYANQLATVVDCPDCLDKQEIIEEDEDNDRDYNDDLSDFDSFDENLIDQL